MLRCFEFPNDLACCIGGPADPHRSLVAQPLRVHFQRTGKTMRQRVVVSAAAWLEIIVGALFLTVPDVLCLLLFGAKPEAIGMPLGRFAGIALLALGIACLPSRDAASPRNAVL